MTLPRSHLFCALLVTAFAYAPGLSAQVPGGLAPGLRVRVQAPPHHPGWIAGLVERGGTDTLYLRTGREVRRIPWTEIQAAEWSRGRRRTAGAVRGAAIGAAVGGVLVSGILVGMYEENANTSRWHAAAFGFMIGGSIGFWPGLAWGSVRGPDRWTPVRLPR